MQLVQNQIEVILVNRDSDQFNFNMINSLGYFGTYLKILKHILIPKLNDDHDDHDTYINYVDN